MKHPHPHPITRHWGTEAIAAAVLLGMALAAPAAGGLLTSDQNVRVLPFTVRGDKPMLEATVAGKKGVLMVDNGTPDALFLNRAALPLPAGPLVATGSAASGQAIEVQSHPAPAVQIWGQTLVMSAQVRSGDFGFTAPGLGDDFLGFVGTPTLEKNVFVLDYAHKNLVVFRVRPDGALAHATMAPADVLLKVPFMLWPGGQPTFAGQVGTVPMVMDIDTGDGGTLYVTSATRAQLLQENHLKPIGQGWQLSGLLVGGVPLVATPVRLVEAGGPEDYRIEGHVDQLRLGSELLARYACVWNFQTKTLTFLRQGSGFLGQFKRPSVP